MPGIIKDKADGTLADATDKINKIGVVVDAILLTPKQSPPMIINPWKKRNGYIAQ